MDEMNLQYLEKLKKKFVNKFPDFFGALKGVLWGGYSTVAKTDTLSQAWTMGRSPRAPGPLDPSAPPHLLLDLLQLQVLPTLVQRQALHRHRGLQLLALAGELQDGPLLGRHLRGNVGV